MRNVDQGGASADGPCQSPLQAKVNEVQAVEQKIHYGAAAGNKLLARLDLTQFYFSGS